METAAEYRSRQNNTKVLLVLAGRKGSGKSTVAKHLVNNYRFDEYAFADEVRYMLFTLYGLDFKRMCGLTSEDREWREQPLPELGGKSVRWALQTLGDTGRLIHPDTWVNVVLKEVKESKFSKIVITDCRYLNEAQRCKEKGGKLIYISRELDRTDSHPSEDLVGLEESADYVIDNNDTERQLIKVVKEIVEHELSGAVKV
jgi:hypothetical protein